MPWDGIAETLSDEAKQIFADLLSNNSFLFCNNNIFLSFLRTLGWGLSKLFIWIADLCSTLFDAVFSFLNFTYNPEITQFIDSFKPVLIAIMCVSIFALGIILMLKHEKKQNVLISVLIFGIVFSSTTFLMTQMAEVMKAGKNAIVGEDTSSIAYETAAANIYDLVYIDKELGGFEALGNSGARSAYPNYEELDALDVAIMNENEVINWNTDKYGISDGSKLLLALKVVGQFGGERTVEDVYTGFGIYNGTDSENWFNEFYYRYSFDWIPLWISEIALAIVFIVMAYKIFRLIFELGVFRIIALVTSANLTSSRKALMTLDAIKNSYIVILVCCLLVRFYEMATNVLSSTPVIADNSLVLAICQLFLALAVIDGPNLIQHLFGIDAGLTSGVARLFVAFRMGQAVGRSVGGSIFRLGASGSDGSGSGGSGSGGLGSSGSGRRLNPFASSGGSSSGSGGGGGASSTSGSAGSSNSSASGSGGSSSGAGGSGSGNNTSGTPGTGGNPGSGGTSASGSAGSSGSGASGSGGSGSGGSGGGSSPLNGSGGTSMSGSGGSHHPLNGSNPYGQPNTSSRNISYGYPGSTYNGSSGVSGNGKSSFTGSIFGKGTSSSSGSAGSSGSGGSGSGGGSSGANNSNKDVFKGDNG